MHSVESDSRSAAGHAAAQAAAPDATRQAEAESQQTSRTSFLPVSFVTMLTETPGQRRPGQEEKINHIAHGAIPGAAMTCHNA